ncbi:MAG TPA: putative phage tail protein [Candidatus Binatia bacterium]|nr:putative phage tail protein [Candidatus Binatia bacterium]
MVFEPTAFEPTAFYVGGASTSPAYARMLWALLPPSRLWRRIGGTLFKVFEADADELARVDARVINLVDEADPRTASELLPEHERELGLDTAATLAERRARVVARTIARQRFRPVDFQAALSPLLGQDAVDVVVIETSHATAVAMGDVREIFRFFIYRDPGEPGPYYLDSAQELVDAIKPTHTAGHIIESIDFLCDDEFSLCDRDLLGA